MAIILLSSLQRNGYSILVLQRTEAWYRKFIVLLNCVVSNKLPDPQLSVSHLHSLSLSLSPSFTEHFFKNCNVRHTADKYWEVFNLI